MTKLSFILVALLIACTPTAPEELSPVFVVMCQDLPDAETIEHPCCTGFAFGAHVVTANHCVPDDYVSLVSNRQWLETSNESQKGVVIARDTVRDIAWLSATLDGPGLMQGPPVAEGDAVRALLRSAVQPGTVQQQVGIFWRTDIDSNLGDSGSAIVNQAGDAVGVLTRCTTMNVECDPNSGIFSELP